MLILPKVLSLQVISIVQFIEAGLGKPALLWGGLGSGLSYMFVLGPRLKGLHCHGRYWKLLCGVETHSPCGGWGFERAHYHFRVHSVPQSLSDSQAQHQRLREGKFSPRSWERGSEYLLNNFTYTLLKPSISNSLSLIIAFCYFMTATVSTQSENQGHSNVAYLQ